MSSFSQLTKHPRTGKWDVAQKYSINKSGIIMNVDRNTVIRSHLNRGGYLMVRLPDVNGKRRSYLVHRLFASFHIPNPLNKKEVNHIDFNKTNNNVSNLEWATPSENTKHAFAFGKIDRKGIKNGRSKLNEYKVREIRKMYKMGNTQKQLSKLFGHAQCVISQVVRRATWRHI